MLGNNKKETFDCSDVNKSSHCFESFRKKKKKESPQFNKPGPLKYTGVQYSQFKDLKEKKQLSNLQRGCNL